MKSLINEIGNWWQSIQLEEIFVWLSIGDRLVDTNQYQSIILSIDQLDFRSSIIIDLPRRDIIHCCDIKNKVFEA